MSHWPEVCPPSLDAKEAGERKYSFPRMDSGRCQDRSERTAV